MIACDLCGSEDGFGYTCKLCSQTHCRDHRLPETHDCPNLEKALPPGREKASHAKQTDSTRTTETGRTEAERSRWTEAPYVDERSVDGPTPDTPRPLPSESIPTYGATPDEDLDNGPDIVSDGSLVGRTDTTMLGSEATSQSSAVSTHLPSRFGQYTEAPLLVLIDLVKLVTVVGVGLAVWYVV